MCNSRGLLLSAETHWPGGLKDTEILERSAIYQQLQEVEEGWLLGEAEAPGQSDRNKVEEEVSCACVNLVQLLLQGTVATR